MLQGPTTAPCPADEDLACGSGAAHAAAGFDDGAAGPPVYTSLSRGFFVVTVLLLLPRQFGAAAIALGLCLLFKLLAARNRPKSKPVVAASEPAAATVPDPKP